MVESQVCPNCGSVMRRGFIIAGRGIYWNDRVPALVCKGAVTLDIARWGCRKVACLRCDLCETIVIPGTKTIKNYG